MLPLPPLARNEATDGLCSKAEGHRGQAGAKHNQATTHMARVSEL
jgi:hypothetical protein